MRLDPAVAAATKVVSLLGLVADEAIVLQQSNRITMRLLPCDVLARVSRAGHRADRFEIEMAQRLVAAGSPVAGPDPRVERRAYESAGYVVTLWSHWEPVVREIAPADYAGALGRLHAGMRTLDVPVPHFTDRVERARRLVADRDRTPDLAEEDRDLLGSMLRRLPAAVGGRGRPEQILHGEPHPGNVLLTGSAGPGPRSCTVDRPGWNPPPKVIDMVGSGEPGPRR